jgi:hypothetical protein
MSLFESVVNYLMGKEKGDNLETPEGACPICWGHQAYNNQIRKIVKDHQIDVNAGREKYAFIQDFVVNHVDGIKLKNTIHGTECPKCGAKTS